jgi:Mg-chelatase subunit ChlD
MNTQYSIVQGSIGAIAKQTNKSIAETFCNADCVVIVDTSGSMSVTDSRGGRSRYEIACEELTNLQNSMPGKIAVISFSSDVVFCPSGIPFQFFGGTDLCKALKFAKIADVPGMRFVLISDGEPDSRDASLAEARTYQNKIDVIYVGPEDNPSGRDFLTRLANLTGGQAMTADRAKQLQASVMQLLGAGI